MLCLTVETAHVAHPQTCHLLSEPSRAALWYLQKLGEDALFPIVGITRSPLDQSCISVYLLPLHHVSQNPLLATVYHHLLSLLEKHK